MARDIMDWFDHRQRGRQTRCKAKHPTSLPPIRCRRKSKRHVIAPSRYGSSPVARAWAVGARGDFREAYREYRESFAALSEYQRDLAAIRKAFHAQKPRAGVSLATYRARRARRA